MGLATFQNCELRLADVAENLLTYLLGEPAIALKTGSRVAQDALPQGREPGQPFIYFGRTGTGNERCLGETTNTPFVHNFAVECIGENINDSQTLADLVRARLELLACGGTFGTQTVSNVFCEDQSDDYVPKAVDPNSGEHVAALSVEVYP